MKTQTILTRTLTIILMAALLTFIPMLPSNAGNAYAAEGICTVLNGENQQANEYAYGQWATPIRSYLLEAGDKLMRVQASETDTGKFQVSYYDPDTYNALSRKTITSELPIFGGFASYNGYYYIVTGQSNYGEDNNAEVVRITKFDTNWQRISSSSLYGANTYEPFEAGSLRFAFKDNMMVIRTCHKMYKSADGNNHQANLTILYNTNTENITDSYSKIWNISSGYVSHSFNQFVGINDSGNIIAVDHGDANTRSVVLCKYPTDVRSGSFTSNSVSATSIIDIAGEKGANYTGLTLGGMVENGSYYFLAGSSVPQDDNMYSYDTKNVFVSRIGKDGSVGSPVWVTNKAEGETSVSNPHIIKTNALNMVLWNEGDEIYYNFINLAGNVYNCDNNVLGKGYLSDCDPIFTGSKIIWYTYENNEETFYEVDTTGDTLKLKSFTNTYEHKYTLKSVESGLATCECSDCGATIKYSVPTELNTKWKIYTSYGDYYYDIPLVFTEDRLEYEFVQAGFADGGDEYNSDMVMVSEDPENCQVDENAQWIEFKKTGTFRVKAYPLFNPTFVTTYDIHVVDHLSQVELSADKTSFDLGDTVKFTANATGGKKLTYSYTCVYPDGYEGSLNNNDALSDWFTEDVFEWTPIQKGTYKVRVIVRDLGESGVVWKESSEITINVKDDQPSEPSPSYPTDPTDPSEPSDPSDPGSSDSDNFYIQLDKNNVSTTKISNKTYTGKAIKPKPDVYFYYNGLYYSLTRNTDYKLSYRKNVNVGTATITITGIGDFRGSVKKTFKIIPKGTKLGKLTGKSKAIKVKWTKCSTKMKKSRITGYQIQYAKNSKFTSAKKIKIKGYKNTSTTIKKLSKKKKYYVRIRTYMKVGNKTYYSKWSKYKSIKTK